VTEVEAMSEVELESRPTVSAPAAPDEAFKIDPVVGVNAAVS
jgi:hypothetical protein